MTKQSSPGEGVLLYNIVPRHDIAGKTSSNSGPELSVLGVRRPCCQETKLPVYMYEGACFSQ